MRARLVFGPQTYEYASVAGGAENLRYSTSLAPNDNFTPPSVTVVRSVVAEIIPAALDPLLRSIVNVACPPSLISPEEETVSQGDGPLPTPVPHVR